MSARPSLVNLDASLIKNNRVSRISDSLNVQFRAEIFNLANHANFADPNPFIDIPSVAGSITSTTTTARQLQMALKLTF